MRRSSYFARHGSTLCESDPRAEPRSSMLVCSLAATMGIPSGLDGHDTSTRSGREDVSPIEARNASFQHLDFWRTRETNAQEKQWAYETRANKGGRRNKRLRQVTHLAASSVKFRQITLQTVTDSLQVKSGIASVRVAEEVTSLRRRRLRTREAVAKTTYRR